MAAPVSGRGRGGIASRLARGWMLFGLGVVVELALLAGLASATERLVSDALPRHVPRAGAGAEVEPLAPGLVSGLRSSAEPDPRLILAWDQRVARILDRVVAAAAAKRPARR